MAVSRIAGFLAVAILVSCKPAEAPPDAKFRLVLGDCQTRTMEKDVTAGADRLSIAARVQPIRDCGLPSSGKFWGSTDVDPAEVMVDLYVRVNGETVQMPVSAFADLGDPSSVEAQRENDKWVISIRGLGDSAYLAKITIIGDQVRLREVTHPGFDPAYVFERTEYAEWAQ